MPMQVAKEKMPAAKSKTLTKKAPSAAAAKTTAKVVANNERETVQYTPANLRPGNLLLLEFSRPGGVKYERDEGSTRKNKRVVTDSPALEKMTSKIVNAAYAKLVQNFAHTPWGFFCEKDEVDKAQELLGECREAAYFTNRFAEELGSKRRIRIDVYPIEWDHTSELFRNRIGEMVATKLIELREIYTSKEMWSYRVRVDRCKNMERLLDGEQSKLVNEALRATVQQRKIMVAKYGDKAPTDWIDLRTGNLRADIKLDFEPIDRAIRHFRPDWEAPPEK